MLKVHMIIPEILYQRGELRGQPRAAKEELVTALGLKVVLNLYGPPDEDLPRWCSYIHLAIPDGKRVDYRAVDAAAESALRLGTPIMTLCHAGRNRSGLASALIVRRVMRVSGSEAMEAVRRGRPRALANEAFAAYLAQLAPPQ